MTQKEMLLKYLHDFGSISPAEAFTDLNMTRLAAVVYDLRRDGYRITAVKEGKANRYGQMRYFVRYKLEDESNV